MDAICPPAGSQGRIVDLSFLSEEEQAKIKSVLDRSVDVIKEEEMRLDEMSRDIEREAEAVRKRAATPGVCVQCETGLPWYRSGARCPECFQIVCKQCRVPPRVKRDFRCTLCEKKRLFRIEKSDCFKFEESSPKDEDDVFGTNLLKRSLKNLELFNSQFPPCKLTRVQTLPPSKGAQSRAEELKSSTPKSTRKTSIEDPPYPDKDVKRSSSQNLPPSSSADEPSQTSPAESEDPDPVPYLERRVSLASSAQSTYSGGGGKGDYSITGEVLFGVEYRNRQLLVHVNEARDLAAADRKTHSSNPYVKTYLLPDLRKETKRKTKPIKKTLNPTFTEILKYEMAESELKEKTLWLSVWDWDRFGKNQFLGEVRVPLSEFDLSTKTEKWWPLTDKDVSHLEDQVSGDLLLGVMFELPGTLHIEVKQARKLRKEHNPNATVDAFVKCYLLPDRHHKGKRKTNVVKNNSSPVWMEQVSFAGLGLAELRTGRVLEVTVWDMHRGSSNEFIGGLRIGCAGSKEWMDSSLEEAGHWNEVLSSPDRWVERWHSLRTTMTSTKAASEGSSVSSRSRPLLPGGSPLASIARKKSRSSSPTRHNRTSKSSLGSDISSNKDILSQKEESPLPTIEGSVAMTTTISAKDEKGEALKVAFKPAHVDSEVNEKPSSPQEVQPSSPQEVQPSSPQEVQPRSPQEVKPSSPQEVKPSSPQEVQPRSPQEVKPSSPQEVKPSSPQEVKPSSPQEVKPSSPQEVQPRSPQEVQPRSPQEVKPSSPQEVKPSSPQEVKPSSPQEVKPSSPQEVQPRSPQEVKPSGPQEVKPSSPQEVNEQSPIPDIVVDPSSSISLEPSQDASVTQEVHASSLARAESFTSLYSTAFEKGDYSITGEVLFGVEYRNGQLLVHIGKARDLAAADRNGSSDPYVKTYLLPDKKKETKRKTKVVKKSLSPVYNEVLQYEMAESELKEKTLWLSVWDWDRFGKNQFLGEVRVPLSEFDLSTKTEKWWPLTDKSSPPTALQWTSVQARSATLVSQKGLPRAESFTSLYSTAGEKGDYSITGEVLFGVEYRNGQLLVHVNEARDLAAADKNGKSNPYIKTYLLPDKKKETKKKTKVMKKTLNPKFDEILKYKLSSLELSQKTLWLSIWSADKFGRNLFLGQVMVPLDKVDLSNGQTKWHTLEDK